jgi:hypothetical protein
MKYKNIKSLLWIRAKKEYPLWIVLFLCLYIISTYFFDCIKCTIAISPETATKINEFALALSYSYVAGIIVYLLTTFIPTTRKARVTLMNVMTDLNMLKDNFHELLSLIGYDCSKEKEDAETDAFNVITGKDSDSTDNSTPIPIKADCVKGLKEYVKKFDDSITAILQFEQYLYPNECEKLVEIKLSNTFQQIRIYFKEAKPPRYKGDGIIEFIQELSKINDLVILLHKDLQQYIN